MSNMKKFYGDYHNYIWLARKEHNYSVFMTRIRNTSVIAMSHRFGIAIKFSEWINYEKDALFSYILTHI